MKEKPNNDEKKVSGGMVPLVDAYTLHQISMEELKKQGKKHFFDLKENGRSSDVVPLD